MTASSDVGEQAGAGRGGQGGAGPHALTRVEQICGGAGQARGGGGAVLGFNGRARLYVCVFVCVCVCVCARVCVCV